MQKNLRKINITIRCFGTGFGCTSTLGLTEMTNQDDVLRTDIDMCQIVIITCQDEGLRKNILMTAIRSMIKLDGIRMALRSPVNSVMDPGECMPAAVLLIICGELPHIIMTRKSARMRVHAGEISFPGGKPEHEDADLCATALRETREEIGLDVDRRNVVGQLQPVSTLSTHFAILPFVSILEKIPEMTPNIEVSDIECIPLESFLRTLARDTGHGPFPEMYELWYDGKQVWGASARILKQIAHILNVEAG